MPKSESPRGQRLNYGVYVSDETSGSGFRIKPDKHCGKRVGKNTHANDLNNKPTQRKITH